MFKLMLFIGLLSIGLLACGESTESSKDTNTNEVSKNEDSKSQPVNDNESNSLTKPIGSLSDVGEMAEKRIEFTGVALPDGRALVMGGVSEGASQGYSKAMSNTAEVFDPTTGTWDFIAEPIKERKSLILIVLNDGRVIAAGGAGNQEFGLDRAEVWNPETNTWTETDTMNFERVNAAGVLLNDGRVFLSGGVDSSLVAALMQKQSIRPIKTFSIGNTNVKYDEAAYAKGVAYHLGTEHHELYLSESDALDVVPKLATIYDEPFADSSAIPTYHLSRVTRQSVTVALSGDGGDEVFGGYRRYRARLLADMFNRMPSAVRWSVERIGEQFREPATYYGSNFRKKIKRFLEFSAAVRADPGTSWAFFLPGPNWTSFFPMSFWRNCLRI